MFTPLSNLIPAALNKLGMNRQAEASQVCERYRKLAPTFVHPDALTHTYPAYYRQRVLTIGVPNGAWAQLIMGAKFPLLKAIKQAFPNLKIADIRTKILTRPHL